MASPNLWQDLMICFFFLEKYPEYTRQRLADMLSDETIDYTQEDNQLFRELHVGRLNMSQTLFVYKTLVEKRNYVMTTKDLERLSYFNDLRRDV